MQRFPDIPHALLLAGPRGVGKQQFAERLIAWVLCQQAGEHLAVQSQASDDGASADMFGDMFADEPAATTVQTEKTDVACGHCESCNWLRSGTHPRFLRITADPEGKTDIIKVDDIRKILPFTQQSSQGFRIVLIEQAQNMNISAANALLKTLEEPARQVLIILTSDQPQRLLPTIRSRVQSLAVAQVSTEHAQDYVAQHFPDMATQDAEQLLTVAGAPLLMGDIVQADWYQARHSWLKVWQALRAGQRQAMAASAFWQKNMAFDDAVQLQTLICQDLFALHTDNPPYLSDVDYHVLKPLPSVDALTDLLVALKAFRMDRRQNVQPAILLDMLMQHLSVM